MEFLYGVLGIIVVLAALIYLFIAREGNAEFEVRTESHTPFVLEKMDEESLTFSTKVEFANVGKQCGTIMDCYVRHLLPYEQFDGVRVFSKAELETAPREDDYFEAIVIQHEEQVNVLLKVTLTARRAGGIQATLADMVDLPLDLIYQQATRTPWTIKKKRIVVTAEEIAALAGTVLANK